MPTIDQLLQFAGRLHPVLLHLPIGALIALGAVEMWGLLRQRAIDAGVRGLLAWLAAASMTGTAVAGWLLAEEPGYAGETIWWHRWLGVSLAGVVVIAAAAQQIKVKRLYAVLLFAAMGLMVPAGHFGSTVTHGADFLWEPFEEQENKEEEVIARPPVDVVEAQPSPLTPGIEVDVLREPALVSFNRQVLPILMNTCVSCHGEAKQRGRLRLDTRDWVMAGGKAGAAVVPGHAGESLLIKLMRLPLEDEDHMPPSNKPQPSEAEVSVIERWIAEGCRADE